MSASAFPTNIGKTFQVFRIEHQEAAGVNSGNAASGSWITRPLNTIMKNDIPGASLSSNVVTLPGGTYEVVAVGGGYYMNGYQTRIRDTTNNTTLVVGSSEHSPATGADQSQSKSHVYGEFVLSDTATVEFQMQVQNTRNGDGFGTSQNFGEVEVYSQVEFRRVVPAVNDGNGELVRGPMCHYADYKADNVDGGSLTSLAWNTRTLNTDLQVGIVGASRLGNVITLPAGDYDVEISAPGYRVDATAIRFRNTTDSTTVVISTTDYNDGTNNGESIISGSGRFSISSSKDFELQHYINNAAAGGQSAGVRLSPGGSSGESSVYGQVRIWKLVSVSV